MHVFLKSEWSQAALVSAAQRCAVLVAVIAPVAAAPQLTVAASDPPNVVLIVSDDQGWTDFGFMGHPEIRTPHLDRLAAASALFPRGYVPTSLCRPSLATLITGLYPHQHKITGNDPPRGTDRSAMLGYIDRVPTLPRLLAEKGYQSFQSGKWWEGNYRLGGFSAGMTHGDPQRGGRHGDDGLRIGREGMQPIFDFIESSGDHPYFVWYAPFLPHTPHNPPERLMAHYAQPGRPEKLARYWAMCEWFDETCGQLLDYIEKRGDAGNTLVVFVTDNGWIQRTKETEVPRDWRYQFAPKSKRSPYDGGLRTPILLSWPDRIRPGRYDVPVHSIDLAPTILAAAGLDPPASMPGLNLLGLAAGGRPLQREALFGETFSHDVADLGAPARGLEYRWCLRDRWKLVLPADANRPVELYDVTADPHETNNRAEPEAGLVQELTELTDAWWNGRPDPEADG